MRDINNIPNLTEIAFPDAKFPGAKIRSDFIAKYDIAAERRVARDSIYRIMSVIQEYTIKQYSLRDRAVDLIKLGYTGEALEILAKIGEIEWYPQLTLTDNERYIRYTKIRMARNAAINLIK